MVAFDDFKQNYPFPEDYHGGKAGGVYDEKRVEHFLAYTLCGLDKSTGQDTYVDVAAGSSPWVHMLREHKRTAYAIDLHINPAFEDLDSYLEMDATATKLASNSINAMSLQCAYEMLAGDSDVRFVEECRRLLRPGGVVVISPLYMHTHHCGYASPEYWGRGYADPDGVEYIRRGIRGIQFSRKYSASSLKTRLLDYIEEQGMCYELYRLMDQSKLGSNVYCHFVLVISKPQ